MEQGFDISQFKWVIVAVVSLIYIFIGKKGAKSPAQPTSTQQGDEESAGRSLEDILGKLLTLEEPKGVLEESTKSVDSESDYAQPVVSMSSRVKESARALVGEDELSAQEIGGSDQEVNKPNRAVDFDLREAVIMSEILTRKYEE